MQKPHDTHRCASCGFLYFVWLVLGLLKHLQSRQGLAFEELERSTAAGGNV